MGVTTAQGRFSPQRVAHIDWSPAYRVIPTRFPAVNLFDRVASPEDFEAL